MEKALKSYGTDKYVPGAMPDEYFANKDKARERLKKKRAGTGNHPMNKQLCQQKKEKVLKKALKKMPATTKLKHHTKYSHQRMHRELSRNAEKEERGRKNE